MPYLEDLIAHEGLTRYLYLDTKDLVTVGIGHLLRTPAAAQALRWRNMITDEPAEANEVDDNYHVIAASRPGHAAVYYEALTQIRLPPGAAEEIAQLRLDNEFLPGLRHQFEGFDDYPEGPRRALVDMVWSLGLFGLRDFTALHAACEARVWERAARSCHVIGVRPERHAWRIEMFASGAPGVA